jgi:hypothetical protein
VRRARRSEPASRSGRAAAARRRTASRQQERGRSAVEALLAEHIGDEASPSQAGEPEVRVLPRARAPKPPTTLVARPTYPPAEDIALGALTVVAEQAWRAGSWAVAVATGLSMRALDVVRAVSPTYATEQADARIAALAERGRAVREERTEAISAMVTTAISTAATSDAMREMSVAAIEEATDDVLAVVLPAMLDAVTEMETQEKLDELMAGLLLRQLPSALEKTLPGVMMRTATKPAAGIMPFLSGVLPK